MIVWGLRLAADSGTFMTVREKEGPPPLAVGKVVDNHAWILGDVTTKYTHRGRRSEMVILREAWG